MHRVNESGGLGRRRTSQTSRSTTSTQGSGSARASARTNTPRSRASARDARASSRGVAWPRSGRRASAAFATSFACGGPCRRPQRLPQRDGAASTSTSAPAAHEDRPPKAARHAIVDEPPSGDELETGRPARPPETSRPARSEPPCVRALECLVLERSAWPTCHSTAPGTSRRRGGRQRTSTSAGVTDGKLDVRGLTVAQLEP